VRTRPRRAAIGATGVTLLLFAATACTSESDDSTESSPAGTATETQLSVDDTPSTDTANTAPSTETPSTETPSEATTAPTDGTGETGGDDPAPTAPPVVVPEALQFSAPLVGGGTFDGAASADKPTVFWFWAPT